VTEAWRSGAAATPRREFLHADDCADALVHFMKVYSGPEHMNVGSGEDIAIKDLAEIVMDVVGFEGELTHDRSKPDGTPRKLMSADTLRALGWTPSISLRDGLSHAYRCFKLEVALA
jgi:GDP-L-fucose synthase